ncbi:MAG: UbiA prenyltransferase family protein [Candidatus Sungbacteria bacterium]|nr:UbiA prenyltransferase family protein [Candidatus Sungbacteria bacterium]
MQSAITFMELLRPKQWLKNIFVIAPVVFSFSFFDPEKVILSLFAFSIFCVASSAVYVFNDAVDAPRDRLHPLKRNRPVARGDISVNAAWFFSILLSLIALAAGFAVSQGFFWTIAAYLLLNLSYTFWLKRAFLLDMFSVALGFVLRVVAGVIAIGAQFSPWILAATFFLALFIVAIKRSQEIKIAATSSLYAVEFLRSIIFVSLILALAIFIFYAVLDIKSILFLSTVLPVLYGMFRFLWLAETKGTLSDNPTDIIFKDFPMQASVAIFVLLVISIFTMRFTSYASIFFSISQ